MGEVHIHKDPAVVIKSEPQLQNGLAQLGNQEQPEQLQKAAAASQCFLVIKPPREQGVDYKGDQNSPFGIELVVEFVLLGL